MEIVPPSPVIPSAVPLPSTVAPASTVTLPPSCVSTSSLPLDTVVLNEALPRFPPLAKTRVPKPVLMKLYEPLMVLKLSVFPLATLIVELEFKINPLPL